MKNTAKKIALKSFNICVTTKANGSLQPEYKNFAIQKLMQQESRLILLWPQRKSSDPKTAKIVDAQDAFTVTMMIILSIFKFAGFALFVMGRYIEYLTRS